MGNKIEYRRAQRDIEMEMVLEPICFLDIIAEMESDSYNPADLRTSNSLEKDLCNLLKDSEEMTQPYDTNTQSIPDLNEGQIDTDAQVESEARAIDLLQNQLEEYEHLLEN